MEEVGKKKQEMNRQPLGRLGERPLWVLHLSNIIRAAHQLGAAVVLSSFLFHFQLPTTFFWLAVTSGALLFLTEGMRHRQIFRELTGVISVFKLVLLGMCFHGLLHGAAGVSIVFIVASLASHAPKNIRHRLLF